MMHDADSTPIDSTPQLARDSSPPPAAQDDRRTQPRQEYTALVGLILIDQDGRIEKVYRKVKPAEHAVEVLAEIGG